MRFLPLCHYSLLANAQTFIGVVITLMVLCLFDPRRKDENEGSNFIRRISNDLWGTFLSILKHDIENLKEKLKKDNIPEKYKGFYDNALKYAQNDQDKAARLYQCDAKEINIIQKFFTDSVDKIEQKKKHADEMHEVQDISFIQRFLLIVCLAVMTLDAITIQTPRGENFMESFGGPFLFMLSLMSILFCALLWGTKFEIKQSVCFFGFWKNVSQNFWKRVIFVIVFSCFLLTVTLILFSVCRNKLIVWIVSALFFIGGFLFVKTCMYRVLPEERYNSSLPLKHAFFVLIVSAIVGTGSFFLKDRCSSYVFYEVISNNASWMVNLENSRNFFVGVVIVTSIIWPIYSEYLYFLFYSRNAKKEITKDFESAKEMIDNIQKEREKIINS